MDDIIRVLIVDDHPLIRRGLIALIADEPGMACVGEAEDGEDGIAKTRALNPDIILMDLRMPNKDGLAATKAIYAENPNVRILILTSFAEDDKVFPAIEAGASGYLLKDSPFQEIVNAIRAVHRGEVHLHQAIAHKIVAQIKQSTDDDMPLPDLTPREIDVLRLVAEGLSNQDIARQLSISEFTVRSHVRNILNKLELESRTQAVLYALRHGFASLY